MEFLRKLPIPKEIKELYPISKELLQIKEQNDQEIKEIFDETSNKFLLIIGPCSADVFESVLEYSLKLKKLQEEVEDKIKIVMRVYTNKPRTISDGYMGMLHQPNLDKDVDLLEGLISCRNLYLNVIKESHLPISDELLYPQNYRYFSDLLSYVTVGARSSLNQEHRLVASGIEVACGMKNSMSGSIHDLTNSVKACGIAHQFLYRGWEVKTSGNHYTHGILRGYQNLNGDSISNIDEKYINDLYQEFINKEITNPSIIIDVNHDNSHKDYLKQIDNVSKVLEIKKQNPILNKFIKGLMIESYLLDGKTTIDNKIYGMSITDACLGIDKTIKLVKDIYQKL